MFTSRGAPGFANGRNPYANSHPKNFIAQGPKNISLGIFKGPAVTPFPYAATAQFDVGYYNIDPQPRRSSWIAPHHSNEPHNRFLFPTNTNDSGSRAPEKRRSKTSSFSIYPGVSKDMFIYEASNSEFSSSNTSLAPLPFSPSLSTSSITAERSPDSPVEPLPPRSRKSSATSAPNSNAFPLHIPALTQAQSNLRNVLHDDSASQPIPSTSSIPMPPPPFISHSAEVDTETTRSSRLEAQPGYNQVPAANLSMPMTTEHQDVTHLYRDIPLRSSPDLFDAAFAEANSARERAAGTARLSTAIQPDSRIPELKAERRHSYAPAPSMQFSISQSTTSTLDPNHPLLAAPTYETYPKEVPRPSNGSASESAYQRSPPQNQPGYTGTRMDNVPASRHANSSSPTVLSVNSSSSSSTAVSERPRVDGPSVNTAQHQIAQLPPQPLSSVTMPVASSSDPPLPHTTHLPASSQPVVNPHPPYRPYAASVMTQSESSDSERSLKQSASVLPENVIFPSGDASNVRRERKISTSTPVSIPPPPTTTTHLPPPPAPSATANIPSSGTRPSAETRVSPTTTGSDDPFARSRTPGPKRSHSDGDNPIYAAATYRSATPFRTEFAPNVSTPASQLPRAPAPPEPQRRYTDGSDQPRSSRASAALCSSRTVRWKAELICPSPILPSQRRKGWFNRRGDQLWTNNGSYKRAPAGEEFPPELASYPDYGEGWMNEDGVRIDMLHRLIPKTPLRSAMKNSRTSIHA